MESPALILDVRGLSVSFRGGNHVQAVENVDLSVWEGDHLCIVGETGSGKSILLLAMLRLLSGDAQVTGDVLYRGESLFRMPQKRLDEVRGGLISYIPQGSGNGMNPLLKVGFQVGEPLMAHCGLKRRDAQRRSVDLLRRFHLQREEAVARQYPFALSGGMRQRAMIAMGVAADAEAKALGQILGLQQNLRHISSTSLDARPHPPWAGCFCIVRCGRRSARNTCSPAARIRRATAQTPD